MLSNLRPKSVCLLDSLRFIKQRLTFGLSRVILKLSVTMDTPQLFLLVSVGLILASTGGESILISHHRVLKSQDHYTPDPVSSQKNIFFTGLKLT